MCYTSGPCEREADEYEMLATCAGGTKRIAKSNISAWTIWVLKGRGHTVKEETFHYVLILK